VTDQERLQALVDEGVISPGDLDLIHWCEEAQEAWDYVQRFYEKVKV